MKTMKVALLATAALAAFSVSARADDAAAIKAQLEALTARIAQLEAAPAVPVGFSLLTISEGAPMDWSDLTTDHVLNKKSHVISILPTADAPAASEIAWDIEIRAAIRYEDHEAEVEDDVNFNTRARVRVVAKTETAVGEVGVRVRIQGVFADTSTYSTTADVDMNIAWGWWQMTPEWQFGGGFAGSLSDPGHGMDALMYYGDTIFLGAGDEEQFRLTYASGPLTWGVALEDNDDADMGLAVSSRIDWAGDAVSFSLAGFFRPEDNDDDAYQLAAGATFNVSDMLTLSINGAIGEEHSFAPDEGFWAVTGYAGLHLSDTAWVEVGAGIAEYDLSVNDNILVSAAFWWQPADQLTMGIQGSHRNFDTSGLDETELAFVTFFTY